MTPRCGCGQSPAPEKAESCRGTHIILMRMTPRPDQPLSVLSCLACLTPISLQWWLSASLFQANFHLLGLSHMVLLFAVGKLRCQGKKVPSCRVCGIVSRGRWPLKSFVGGIFLHIYTKSLGGSFVQHSCFHLGGRHPFLYFMGMLRYRYKEGGQVSFHPTVLHNLGLCSLYPVNFETD